MNHAVTVGDCREVMASMDESSVDAVVTDPPYGLGFMGKGWDHAVPGVEFWSEALRVAKPGAHLLAFGGTRLFHRLVSAVEDAGWEVRDTLMWVYGSGFPKSHDVSKAIDKAAGAERAVVGIRKAPGMAKANVEQGAQGRSVYEFAQTSNTPATDLARKWQGWGTALKPAYEPIVLARKPLTGTVAANVTEWGTGAVNVEGCRVPGDDHAKAWDKPVRTNIGAGGYISDGTQHAIDISKNKPTGRWPANLIHDGSDETTAGMGEAARYFYCSKANKRDRGDNNNHPTRQADRVDAVPVPTRHATGRDRSRPVRGFWDYGQGSKARRVFFVPNRTEPGVRGNRGAAVCGRGRVIPS
jgi:hypothetical protein